MSEELDDTGLVPVENGMDLEIKIIKETIGIIETNALEVLANAKKKCEEYKDVTRFIGNEAIAKKEKASLNKAEKKAAEIAGAIRKKWLAPLELFEETMKAVRAEFKNASAGLDVVVKKAEEKENEDKALAIRLYFNTKNFDLVPFEQLFNDRWLLKGSKMKDIEKELDEKIDKIYSEIQVLERIPDHGTAAKAFYLEHLDIGRALTEVDRLKAAAEKIAREKVEREEREAAAKVLENQKDLRNEERQEAKDEQIKDLAAEALGAAEAPEPERKGPDLLCTSLRFKIKPDTYRDLRAWLSSRGVPYKTVSLFKTDEDAAVFMEREAIAGEIYAAVIH
ncbi:hypothetical protein AGMMS49944_03650 [Spirochaetia bacterium]|nr:hypothetical protein AGMMS49944_03650 [Spirochaetia bacterium]